MNPTAMLWGLIATAIAIGAILPLQGLINARLGEATGGAIVAAFVSFLIGTVALGAWLLATRNLPSAPAEPVPWWIWTGGVLGAVYVALATFLMPRLGSAAVMCLLVFGQIAAALWLEHHGVLQRARPVDALRLLGGALVLAGVVLVVAPWRR